MNELPPNPSPAPKPDAAENKHPVDPELELLAPPASAPVPAPSAPDSEYAALDILVRPSDDAGRERAPDRLSAPPRPVFQPEDSMVPPARQPASQARSDRINVDQDAVGATVFAEFVEEFARETARGDLCNQASLQLALERLLQDPRLLNQVARTGFERRVGNLLADGWRQGHHVLFDAAAHAFHWLDDGRRLDALGELGALLNNALMEYAIYLKTPAAGLKNRQRLIERLRDPAPPEAQDVATNLKTIELMLERYPTWMRIVTNVNNIGVWREREAVHAREVLANRHFSKASEQKIRGTQVMVVLGIVGVLVVVAFFKYQSLRPQPYQTYPAYVPSYQPPRAPTYGPRNYYSPPRQTEVLPPVTSIAPPSGPTTRVHYSEAQFKQATDKIKSNLFFPAPDLPIRDDQVKYSIEVDADGRVIRLNKIASSALPAFDDAVRKAIYHSQPFPTLPKEGTSAVFTIWAKPTN